MEKEINKLGQSKQSVEGTKKTEEQDFPRSFQLLNGEVITARPAQVLHLAIEHKSLTKTRIAEKLKMSERNVSSLISRTAREIDEKEGEIDIYNPLGRGRQRKGDQTYYIFDFPEGYKSESGEETLVNTSEREPEPLGVFDAAAAKDAHPIETQTVESTEKDLHPLEIRDAKIEESINTFLDDIENKGIPELIKPSEVIKKYKQLKGFLPRYIKEQYIHPVKEKSGTRHLTHPKLAAARYLYTFTEGSFSWENPEKRLVEGFAEKVWEERQSADSEIPEQFVSQEVALPTISNERRLQKKKEEPIELELPTGETIKGKPRVVEIARIMLEADEPSRKQIISAVRQDEAILTLAEQAAFSNNIRDAINLFDGTKVTIARKKVGREMRYSKHYPQPPEAAAASQPDAEGELQSPQEPIDLVEGQEQEIKKSETRKPAPESPTVPSAGEVTVSKPSRLERRDPEIKEKMNKIIEVIEKNETDLSNPAHGSQLARVRALGIDKTVVENFIDYITLDDSGDVPRYPMEAVIALKYLKENRRSKNIGRNLMNKVEPLAAEVWEERQEEKERKRQDQ